MITDTFLQNIAGLINGESTNIPTHAAFSSSVIEADATRTSLPSELDVTRPTVSKTRDTTLTTYTFLRSGTAASSSGDFINSMGLIDSATGGFLMADAIVSSLLHTTDFDVDVSWSFEIRRV